MSKKPACAQLDALSLSPASSLEPCLVDEEFCAQLSLLPRGRNVQGSSFLLFLTQGVPHWNVANDRSLLFDRAASELELLDVTDADLMKSIYHDNGSGWITIGVVRDPVTRMLSAYLDIVQTWRAGWQEHRQQMVRWLLRRSCTFPSDIEWRFGQFRLRGGLSAPPPFDPPHRYRWRMPVGERNWENVHARAVTHPPASTWKYQTRRTPCSFRRPVARSPAAEEKSFSSTAHSLNTDPQYVSLE